MRDPADVQGIDITGETARLCVQGTQAECARKLDEARALYARAWEAARDDYERSMAAHYVAHLTTDPVETHRWNLAALDHARRDSRAAPFLGSLLVCLGDSHEKRGETEAAEACYGEAARRGVVHLR